MTFCYKVVVQIDCEENLMQLRDQVEIEIHLTKENRTAKIEPRSWFISKVDCETGEDSHYNQK